MPKGTHDYLYSDLRFDIDRLIRKKYFVVTGGDEDSFTRWYYADMGPFQNLCNILESLKGAK